MPPTRTGVCPRDATSRTTAQVTGEERATWGVTNQHHIHKGACERGEIGLVQMLLLERLATTQFRTYRVLQCDGRTPLKLLHHRPSHSASPSLDEDPK